LGEEKTGGETERERERERSREKRGRAIAPSRCSPGLYCPSLPRRFRRKRVFAEGSGRRFPADASAQLAERESARVRGEGGGIRSASRCNMALRKNANEQIRERAKVYGERSKVCLCIFRRACAHGRGYSFSFAPRECPNGGRGRLLTRTRYREISMHSNEARRRNFNGNYRGRNLFKILTTFTQRTLSRLAEAELFARL